MKGWSGMGQNPSPLNTLWVIQRKRQQAHVVGQGRTRRPSPEADNWNSTLQPTHPPWEALSPHPSKCPHMPPHSKCPHNPASACKCRIVVVVQQRITVAGRSVIRKVRKLRKGGHYLAWTLGRSHPPPSRRPVLGLLLPFIVKATSLYRQKPYVYKGRASLIQQQQRAASPQHNDTT